MLTEAHPELLKALALLVVAYWRITHEKNKLASLVPVVFGLGS